MSTYGGDSFVPENLYRKRRVAELLGEEIEDDQVRLLSNGGLACLVCPNRPVLDSMPMLQIHRKGARHLAAAENLRERNRRLHQEIQKRIALGSDAIPSTGSSSNSNADIGVSKKKVSPLLAATKNIKNAVLLGQVDGVSEAAKLQGNVSSVPQDVKPYVSKRNGMFFQSQAEIPASSIAHNVGIPASSKSLPEKANEVGSKFTKPTSVGKSSSSHKRKMSDRGAVELKNDVAMQELRRQAQRELKWKEAGWRRDSSGRWSRDENVEFDSDEEVPVNDI
ncbi:unnamed protein product [Calypogeia fissa]